MKHVLYIIAICLSFNNLAFAQQKVSKPAQTIKTDKNAEVTINTQNVNLELDTWNRDYIEIEASLSSDSLSKEELKELLEGWNIDVAISGKNVTISSQNSSGLFSNDNFYVLDDMSNHVKELELNLSQIPIMDLQDLDIDIQSISSMEIPEFPELPELPELENGNYNISFEMSKYKKDGEAYLQKWSKEFGDKYGEAYQKQMKEWAKKVSKLNFDSYKAIINHSKNTNSHKNVDVRINRSEKRIKEREKLIEKRAELIEERAGKREKLIEKRELLRDKKHRKHREKLIGVLGKSSNHSLFHKENKDIIKNIKIKMPKKAKINLNVKHGELKLSSIMTDLKADLAYTNLIANRINGRETSINTSYSNVNVNHWNSGLLNLNYVDKANLNTVNAIVLHANSSKVFVNNLIDNAEVISNFGDLTIKQIEDVFTNVKLDLQGSDTLINVPENEFNLIFKGTQSKFNNEIISSKTINKNTSDANKNIVINAKFSNVYTN